VKSLCLMVSGLCGWLLLSAAGCTNPIYDEASGRSPYAMTPRSTWKIVGDVRDPQKAIDNDLGTAAVTGPNYENAVVTIDLGKPRLFNMVVIDHGRDEMGFCKRVAVYTSQDGQNFAYQYATLGTRRVTVIALPNPTLARYIRLQAVVPGANPWSLAEIYVF
jgi:hypothetical protein